MICCVIFLFLAVPLFLLILSIVYASKAATSKRQRDELARGVWSWGRQEFKKGRISLFSMQQLQRFLTQNYAKSFDHDLTIPQRSTSHKSALQGKQRDKLSTASDKKTVQKTRPAQETPAVPDFVEIDDKSSQEIVGHALLVDPEQVAQARSTDRQTQPQGPKARAQQRQGAQRFQPKKSPAVAPLQPEMPTDQASHPLDRPIEPPQVPVLAEPRKPFHVALQAFMSEKNIHWGELLSGILIVGSALGLILSLRSQFEQAIPYFSSLMFLLLTAAMHGAGHYTLRRWKLQTTSRGVLLIASLLLPLNLLLGCLLANQGGEIRSIGDPVYWSAILIGGGCLTGLAFAAGRCLVPQSRWAWPIALVGTSLPLLWINRGAADSLAAWQAMSMVLPPIAAYFASLLLASRGRSGVYADEGSKDLGFLTPLFRVAGVGAFSVVGTLSFYIWRSPQPWIAVQWMGPGLALLAVAALYLGQVLHQKRVEKNTQLLFLESNFRIVFGILMVASLVLGWPDFFRFVIAGVLLTTGVLVASWLQRRQSDWAVGLGLGVAVLTCLVTRGVVLVGGLPESQDLTWGGTWLSWPAALTYGVCGIAMLLKDVNAPFQMKFLRPPWWEDEGVPSGKDEMQYLGGGLLALAGGVVCKLAFGSGTPFEHMFGTVSLAIMAMGVGGLSFGLRRLDGVLLWFVLALLSGGALLFRVLPDYLPESLDLFWEIALVGLAISGVTAVFSLLGRRHSSRAWRTGFIKSDPLPLARAILMVNTVIASAALLPLLELKSTGLHLTHALVAWSVVAIWLANAFSVRSVSLFGLARFASCAALVLTVIAFWNLPDGLWESGDARLIVFCETALAIWLSVAGVVQWKLGSASWLRWSRPSVVVDNLIFSGLAVLFVMQSLLQLKLSWLDTRWLTENLITYEWFASSRWGWFVLLGVMTEFTFFRHFVLGQDNRHVLTGWYAATVIAWSAWLSQWGFLGIDIGLRFSLWTAFLLVVASWVPETRRMQIRLRNAAGQGVNESAYLSPWVIGALVAATVGILEVVLCTLETTRLWANTLGAIPGPTMGVTLLSLVGPWVLVSLGASITFYHKVGRSALKIAFTCGHAGALTAAALLLAGNWLSGGVLSTQLLVHSYWGWGHLALLYGGVWGLNRWRQSGKPIENPRLPAYEVVLTIVSGLLGAINLLVILTHWMGYTYFVSVHGLQWGAWGIAVVSVSLVYRRHWLKGIGVLLGLLTGGMVAGSMVSFEASDTSILIVLSIWLASMLGVILVSERWTQMNAGRSGFELAVWRFAKLALYGLGFMAGIEAWIDPSLLPGWRIGLGFVWIALAVWLQVDYQDLVQRLITVAVVPAILAMVLWQTPFQSVAVVRENELTILGLIILCLGVILPRLETLSSNVVLPTWGRTEFKPLDAIQLMIAGWIAVATTVVAFAQFFGPPSWLILDYPGWACLAAGVVLSGIDLASRNRRYLALSLWLLGLHSLWILLSVVPVASKEINLSIALLSYGAFLLLFTLFFFRSTWWSRLVRQLGWTNVEATMEWWRKVILVVSFCWVLINIIGLFGWHFYSDSRALKIAFSGSWTLSAIGLYLVAVPSGRRRFGILVAGFIAGLSVLWSDLGPWVWEPSQLIRLTRFLLATLLATLTYGVVLPKWLKSDEWLPPLRVLTQASGVSVIVGMAVLLPLEMMLFEPGLGLPLPVGQSLMVVVLLMAFSACALVGAAVPGRLGWSLSDTNRQGLMYLSEAFIGLTCLQTYLTFPHLFQGFVQDYWPFILLVSSMIGAGLGHWIRGRGAQVIGLPLLRTATWAPLIPIFVLWWFPSRVDEELVMAAIGLVYMLVLSPIHKNWNYGWISAICFNLALLCFWGRIDSLSFEMHPQLWLIPPAVTVLAALQVRRHDLPQATVTLGRYLCMAVIYVSSTWEIFESGIGDSLWPPMILALLSLVGAFLGFAFHIRGFVYFGTLFLMMSVLTMVAHAQKSLDHTWPWWVFGIVSGISILTFFGLLERQSDKTRHWLKQWRQWDH